MYKKYIFQKCLCKYLLLFLFIKASGSQPLKKYTEQNNFEEHHTKIKQHASIKYILVVLLLFITFSI